MRASANCCSSAPRHAPVDDAEGKWIDESASCKSHWDRTSRLTTVAQTVQLEFLHKSGIALRPGGTLEISRRWNRRDRDPKTREPRRGGRPASVCRPSGAGNISLLASGGYAPLHHRLISAAPPPQKTCIETLAGQFALLSPSVFRISEPQPGRLNHFFFASGSIVISLYQASLGGPP